MWTFWLNGAKIILYPATSKWKHQASTFSDVAKGVGLDSLFKYLNELGETKVNIEQYT